MSPIQIRRDYLTIYPCDTKLCITKECEFQSEKLWVAYFWDKYLLGQHSYERSDMIIFDVSKQDLEIFPELGKRSTIRLVRCGNTIEEL